jgi:hypothetical protein
LPHRQPPLQSLAQLAAVSPQIGWQMPFPHWQVTVQSFGQLAFVSPHCGWHWKLPQIHG